ncbi:histidine phosphatase family protein [Bacillus sp. 2205SS5-2]|uniref:histidine phosphatase family protein n=1 Tax=Bacillus sp. 2205SS5-2 TaxID=3109031 RepID=UPI003005664F
MKTTLYLVRHAHSVYTSDEYERPLSRQGFEDAIKVADLLQNEKIDQITSSPYRRAKQTVEVLAGSLGIEIEVYENLKERRLALQSVDNFESSIEAVWRDEQFAWPGGESNAQAQKRGIAATEMLLQKYRGQSIVVGTHGNLMVLIMNHYDQQYDYNFWKKLAMPDIYQLTFEDHQLTDCRRIWVK